MHERETNSQLESLDESIIELPDSVRLQINNSVFASAKRAVEEIRLATAAWPRIDMGDTPVSDEQQARELVNRLTAEAEATADAQSARLFVDVARIFESSLSDKRSALKSALRALRADPQSEMVQQIALRLMTDFGNGEMLSKIVDEIVDRVDNVARKASLMLSLALFQEFRANDPTKAIASYKAVLAEDPTQSEAIEGLFRLLLRSEDWSGLAEICRKAADHEDDNATRASLLLAATLLARDTPKDERAQWVEQALEANHQSRLTLPLAVGLFRAAHDTESAVRILREQAKRCPEDAARLYFQASWMLSQDPTRSQETLQAAELAVKHGPQSPLYLTWLAERYRHESMWEPMVDVLSKKAELDTSIDERIETYVTTADVLVARLNRIEPAIELLERAIEIAPSDLACLQALGRLYATTERWEELAQMHLKEASVVASSEQRASALYRCARILIERMNQTTTAIQHLEQAVTTHPSHLPAKRMLEEIYRKEQQFKKLADMYREEIAGTADDERRIAILERLAALLEYQLNQPEKAGNTYRELLDIQPDHAIALRALPRIYEQLGDHTQLLSALRAQVAHSKEPLERSAILIRMGQVIEEKLSDAEQALAHYREALDTYPSSDVFVQIGRLLHANQRWRDLLDLYRQQLDLSSSNADRLSLLYRIGRLHEEYFDDLKNAAAAYREALEVDRSYQPALRGALRVAQQLPDLAEAGLDAILLDSARVEAQQPATEIRIAMNLINERPNDARELLLRTVGADTDGQLARDLLLQHWVEDAHWNDVIGNIGTLDAVPVVTAGMCKPVKALELTKGAVEADPESLVAIRWLELLQAAVGDTNDLPQVLKLRAERESNMLRKNSVRLRLAYLAHENEIDEIDPAALCKQVLEDSPGDERALDLLARVAVKSGDRSLSRDVLELREKSCTSEAEESWLQAARGRLLHLDGDHDQAINLWRKALEADPGCQTAYEGLKQQYWNRGDKENLRWTLKTGVDQIQQEDIRILDLIQYADLCIAAEASDEAVAALEKVLALDPAQPNAIERMTSLLQQNGQSERLVERLRSAAEGSTDPKVRTSLYLRLGIMLRDNLNELEQSVEAFEKAVKAAPENVAALLAAADVHIQLDQPTEAVVLLNQATMRAKDTAGEEELLVAHLALAHICDKILDDPTRARRSLQYVLEIDEKNREALTQLAEISERANDTELAIQSLVSLAEAVEEDERFQILGRLARAYYRADAKSTKALETLGQALELAPGDKSLIKFAIEVYSNAEDWEGLSTTLAKALEHLSDEDRTPVLLVQGRILSQRLDRPEDARDVLREAVRRDPSQEEAIELLLNHLSEEDFEDAELRKEAIDLHRRLLNNDPLLVDSIRTLAMLCRKEERNDEAFCAEAALVFLGEATEEEQYFYKKRKRSQTASEPTNSLSAERLGALLAVPGQEPSGISKLLTLIQDKLGDIFPADLSPYGIGDPDDHALAEKHPAQRVVSFCAKVLGVGDYKAVEIFGGAPLGASEIGQPPLLLVPSDLSRLSVPEQRFVCGRALTRIALRTEAFDSARAEPISLRDFELLLAALVRTQEPDYGEDVASAVILDDMVENVTGLGDDTLKEAAALAKEILEAKEQRNRLASWIQQSEVQSYRGALVCSGNLESVLAFAKRSGRPLTDSIKRNLVGFVTSQSYADLRHELGIAM